jgi:hypothetical protein
LRKISLALRDAHVAGLELLEQGPFGHRSVLTETPPVTQRTFAVASDDIRTAGKVPAEFIVSDCFDGPGRNRWQQLAVPRNARFARQLWQCPSPH